MTTNLPDFNRLLPVFDEVDSELEAGGYSVTLFHNGKQVLSHAAGWDREGVAYSDLSLSVAFSCTKGISALLIGMLIDDGAIELKKPVANYWPEFAKVSSTLTVSGLLEHRAGLSAPREDLTFEQALDHDFVINRLLNQQPLWEPGTAYEYHAFTFGTLVSELAKQVSGETIGQLLQKRIAEPLGIECYIGIPKEKTAKVSPLVALEPFLPSGAELGSNRYWLDRALNLGKAFPAEEIGIAGKGFDSAQCHMAELPGVNGIFSSHSLAKIWSAAALETDGVKLLSDQTRYSMTKLLVNEPSFFGDNPTPLRGAGVMLHSPNFREFLSDSSFGHDGFGGRVGFADSKHQIGFAFTTNRLVQGENPHKYWDLVVAELQRILGEK